MSLYKSQWEIRYHNYKKLHNSWSWNNNSIKPKEQAFRNVITGIMGPKQILKEMQQWGYGLPEDDLWEKALSLRKVIRDIPQELGLFEDEPLDDVYQAALRMEISSI